MPAMSFTSGGMLAWLAIPLVAGPWLERDRRSYTSVAALAFAALGLGAIARASGTLDIGALRSLNAAPDAAWFNALTAVATLVAVVASAFRAGRDRAAQLLLALPLAIGLAAIVDPREWSGWLTGAMVGAAPYVTSMFIRRRARAVDQSGTAGRVDLLLTIVALGVFLAGAPLAIAAMLAIVVVSSGRARASFAANVSATMVSIAVASWAAFAATVAGSPLALLRTFGHVAPLSSAADTLLAALAFVWAIGLISPWPMERIGIRNTLLPVAALLVHFALVHAAPEGRSHWLPLVWTLAVVTVAGAAITGRTTGAARAIVLLGASARGFPAIVGGVTLALALAIGQWRKDRIDGQWWITPLLGSAGATGMALVVFAMLQEQIVLSMMAGLLIGTVALATGSDIV